MTEIIQNIAMHRSLDLSTQYRYVARAFLQNLRDVMERHDVFILLFHQLDEKACRAAPTYIPKKTDFQDIKTIANNMEWCFLLGRLDPNNICWFHTDKVRTAKPTLQTLRMDGDNARFVKVTGWTPGHDGNFINYEMMSKAAEAAPVVDDPRTADIMAAYKATDLFS